MTAKEPEMKPCPLCGSTEEVCYQILDERPDGTPVTHGVFCDSCNLMLYAWNRETRMEIEERWNRRP